MSIDQPGKDIPFGRNLFFADGIYFSVAYNDCSLEYVFSHNIHNIPLNFKISITHKRKFFKKRLIIINQ